MAVKAHTVPARKFKQTNDMRVFWEAASALPLRLSSVCNIHVMQFSPGNRRPLQAAVGKLYVLLRAGILTVSLVAYSSSYDCQERLMSDIDFSVDSRIDDRRLFCMQKRLLITGIGFVLAGC